DSGCGADEWQLRKLGGVLDRRGDVPLVLGGVAGHSTSTDLAAVGDELPQQTGVLVVDVGDLLLAENANLLLGLARRWLRHRGAPSKEPRSRGNGRGLDDAGGLGGPSERRVVGEAAASAGGPGVVGRGAALLTAEAAALLTAAESALRAAEAAALAAAVTAALPLGLVDLG